VPAGLVRGSLPGSEAAEGAGEYHNGENIGSLAAPTSSHILDTTHSDAVFIPTHATNLAPSRYYALATLFAVVESIQYAYTFILECICQAHSSPEVR
jgi:hypothetical protein